MSNMTLLIEEAGKLETTPEKIDMIFKYILDNVEYNYATDFKSLLLQHYDEIIDDYETLNNGDENYSRVFKLRDFVEIETKKLIGDSFKDKSIEDKEIHKLSSSLIVGNENESPMQVLGNTASRISPPIVIDGLLARGNSYDIVDFMSDYFKELGIRHVRLSGASSSMPHEWLLVFDGALPYHVDPTQAIFVRDKVFNLNGKQVDYSMMTNTDLFSLDENRTIKVIGTRILANPITKDNYVQPYDEDRVNQTK